MCCRAKVAATAGVVGPGRDGAGVSGTLDVLQPIAVDVRRAVMHHCDETLVDVRFGDFLSGECRRAGPGLF